MNETLTPSKPATAAQQASGPLAGIRIVEFAGLGPGPFASMMLADMGADVVTLMRGEQKQGLRGAIMMRGRRQIACDLKDKACAANVLTLFLYAAIGVFFFLFPLSLMQVHRYSATAAGAASLPIILLMFAMSRWSGGLAGKYGGKIPLIVGPLIAAIGFAVFAAGMWSSLARLPKSMHSPDRGRSRE